MLSIPKLFAVLILANAALISLTSVVLKLYLALFLSTSYSPVRRGLGTGTILSASSLLIEQKKLFNLLEMSFYGQFQCQTLFRQLMLLDLDLLLRSSLIAFHDSFMLPWHAVILSVKYCFFS